MIWGGEHEVFLTFFFPAKHAMSQNTCHLYYRVSLDGLPLCLLQLFSVCSFVVRKIRNCGGDGRRGSENHVEKA